MVIDITSYIKYQKKLLTSNIATVRMYSSISMRGISRRVAVKNIEDGDKYPVVSAAMVYIMESCSAVL